MKKLLGLFLLAAASAFGLSVNDLRMSQATSASPPAYVDRIFTPVANSLVGLDGSIRPVNVTLGANLSLTGNVLSATSSGGSVNWGSIGGVLANQADLVAALAGKQSTLTFSTGLTNTAGTITVNATQVISRLSNLTTNGFVKTSSANGTLTIDTSTYLTTNQTINFTPDASGDVHGGSSGQTSLAPILVVSGLNDVAFTTMTTGVLKVTNGTGAITTGGTVTSSGLTMATARLLGRTTGSSGAVEEISIGSGLSLSGGSLSATGSGGTGTVTTVSVVTANGISGSVANPTTTPAITLTLGAISPSTVNALTLAAQTTGFTIAGGTSSKTLTVSGNATVSGTNTGDQTTITGNAGTATALQTARAINGVDFNGTAPITVTAAADTLTGTTLNSTVVTSSLTAVGVIGTGAWQGSVVTGTYGGTGINNSTRTITIAGNLATVGAFSTTLTTTATTALTLPTSGTLSSLETNETFTGIKTFSPTLRATGSASYLTVNMPADAAITTTAESIGVSFAAGTRTWATGAVALQREHVFGANTVAAAAASTFTTVVNVDIADPVAGTNATITNGYSLRAATVYFSNSLTISGNATVPSSSGSLLHLVAPDATIANLASDTSQATGLSFTGRVCGGTMASPAATPAGTTLVQGSGQGYANGAYTATKAYWAFKTQNLWSVSDNSTLFVIGLTPSGSTTRSDVFSLTNSTMLWTGGIVTLGAASGTTGAINFKGTTSGTVTLSTADAAGTWTMKLPTSAGTNLYVLQTDGSGNTSWVAQAGGGSGTVNSGTSTNFAYYAATGAAVSGTGTFAVSSTGRLTMTPTAVTSGTSPYLTINIPADTGLTTATEAIGLSIVSGSRAWADGTVASQSEIKIAAPTYNKTTTSTTFTKAATLSITNSPIAGTSVTITNGYALWVQAGKTQLDGAMAVDTTTLTVDATNHRVGVGTASPAKALSIVGSNAQAGMDRTANTAGNYSLMNWATGGTQKFVMGMNADTDANLDVFSLLDLAFSSSVKVLSISGGKVTTRASTTAAAGLNLPHGAAPTSPVDGDIWTTSSGIFVRINGVTVGPLN